MKTIYRILGQRGRITIPYAIRAKLGFNADDVLSFKESKDGKSVVVRREKICDGCKTVCEQATQKKKKKSRSTDEEITLYEFLNGLSAEQQHAALVHLSVKWAAMQGGEEYGA